MRTFCSMPCCNRTFSLFVLAFLLAFVPVNGGAATAKPTFHAGLSAANEAAASDQSLVLLIFEAEWCGPCHLLKTNTLSSPEFVDHSGPLRIAQVDVDADEKTARSFDVTALPNLVLLTADGKIVLRQTGYIGPVQLVKWIEEGRQRVKLGQWEGTAPGAKLNEFLAKAAGDGLDTNDLRRLSSMLGESDPAERAGIAKLLLGQREQAVEPLIESLNDAYLGVRIAATELLQKLAPDAVHVDPWQAPAELREAVEALKKWWRQTGKLPPPGAAAADPSVDGSIKAALASVRAADPVKRTEAMATLVRQGEAALSALREAMKREEQSGDGRAIAWLEEVRWAILIPDELESRVTGARTALARGSSPERQAAATRLGRAGHAAIQALAELVNDADALVVETAVRALSTVGGNDTIPAMAALLQATDGNLRMTAAQALGRTKNKQAAKPLVALFNDPNELVACTAISAFEEINAKESSGGTVESQTPEAIAALKQALIDSRWRVRATTVEAIGKLHVADLLKDLLALLHDSDAFVVKNTVLALGTM